MAEVRCPECGDLIDVLPFLALHRWPAVYPDDARAALLACTSGDPVHVTQVLLDDSPPSHLID